MATWHHGYDRQLQTTFIKQCIVKDRKTLYNSIIAHLSQGIDLSPLQKEALATAKLAIDNHYISRQTYEKKTRWFE